MAERLVPICITVSIHVILAVSVNIISGYARQLCLGQGVFAALGAYTSALLSLHLGVSFWLACPLSCLLAGGVGLCCGLPLLRLPRYYLLVMTLGLNFLWQHLWQTQSFAGGVHGLGRIPRPSLFGVAFKPLPYLLLVIVALGGCIVIDRSFWYSRYGQLLRNAATDISVAPARIGRAVLVAFVTSTAMAGLAGSFFAHFETFISPLDFDFSTSLFILALAAGGGLGSLPGVILGAMLIGGLVEIVPAWAPYRLLGVGIIFLLVGLWFPRGLFTCVRRFPAWHTGATKATPGL